MQPGYPGQDPYGQQPPSQDPTAPQYQDPTAPQYQDPYAQPPQPYGQPTSGQPAYGQPPTSGQPSYGQPPTSGQPAYGQPPYADPYGQAASGQPYGGAAPAYPGAPAYGQPAQGQSNTFGLVSMILGIAAIPLNCCYLGIPLGIAAAIMGFLGKQKADQGLASNRGQAMAGLICGLIGAALGIVYLILVFAIGLGMPLTS